MSKRQTLACVVFCALMLAVWLGVQHSNRIAVDVSLPRAFVTFVLLFAPLWFFGFGAAESLNRLGRWLKIATSAALSAPYFVFTCGTPEFYWRAAVIVVALPLLLAAFLELPGLPERMTVRDVIVLVVIVCTYFEGWLHIAWPSSLGLFPKLFLGDITLYCFLVVRKLEGAGYSLIPVKSDVQIGLREWVLYLPIAIGLGEPTGFIHFHTALPDAFHTLGLIFFTFFLVALPEEMFFRSVLQNLLETRCGKFGALIFAAILFGLSHFNHGSTFNWRYVLLATIAGIFYGRAWRGERRVFAAIITHTAVDVAWSLWFK